MAKEEAIDQTPQFPEGDVDALIKNFGKKADKKDVDAVEALARKLRPQYEKVEQVRKLGQKPKKQNRKLDKRI